jgi:hypothetical protein
MAITKLYFIEEEDKETKRGFNFVSFALFSPSKVSGKMVRKRESK